MPIVGFTHTSPIDAAERGVNVKGIIHNQDFRAYDPDLEYDKRPVIYGPHCYWTFQTHIGLCLSDHENNGYDDSDFWMLVWNPATHQPERVDYATTRGWTYPAYASAVDATPEVRAAYAQYLDAEARVSRMAQVAAEISRKCDLRATARALASILGFPHYRLTKLRRVLSSADYAALTAFLGRNLRSKFKLKLRAQVVAWLNDAAPKYPTPLSRKQMEWIA